MKCKFLISFLVFLWAFAQSPSLFGQIIAQEDFDEPDGSTVGTMSDGSTWVASPPGECDVNFGIFYVNNGSFEIQDVEGFNCCSCSGGAGAGNCGDNQNILLFEDIDISNVCGNIRITSEWLDEGNMECEPGGPFLTCEGGHDQLVAEYSVDNGPFVQFGYYCGNTLQQAANSGFVISGNSLDIRFSGGNQAQSEKYTIVDVVVEADGGGASPTGTLTGTANLCPGACEDVTWDISGGTAPYNLVFEVSSGPFSLTQGLPGLPNMGSLTVCYDENGVIPSFDVGTNTLNLVDGFGTSFLLELLSITDDNDCMSVLTGQEINITLGESPSINSIPAITVCGEMGMPVIIDLSDYDAAIGSGQTVIYYSDPALTMEIGPMYQITGSTTIYAVVSTSGTCISDPIAIDIIFQPAPSIDDPGPIIECGQYTLPVITGVGLTSTVSYWTGQGQTGTPIAEGTVIAADIILYIYDEGAGCPSEVTFSINILPEPEIDQPNNVIACGAYILPPITGNNLSGFESYYTQPNQGGTAYAAGAEITTNTVLYIYDNLDGCPAEVFFVVEITDGPEIMMPDTLSACNSIVLPSISGEGLTSDVSYFTGQNGTGDEFSPGTEIDNDIVLYAYDGTTDCFDETLIQVIVPQGPILNQPEDVTVCDYFVLEEIEGDNLQDPFYVDVAGESYFAGDSIFVSVTECCITDSLLGQGVVPDCSSTLCFSITIMTDPIAGEDVAFNDCGGSVVDLLDVQGADADTGGIFIDTSSTGALSGSTLDVGLINGSSFSVFYEVENMCGLDTSVYTVNITDNADAGNNTSSSVCSGEDLTLVDFINQADPGGVFFNTESNMEVTDFNSDEIVAAGGSLLFYYIVGAGGTCDPDTADINFTVVTSPTLDLPSDETLCSGYELPEIMGTNLSGTENYNTMLDGSGTIYQPGDTLDNSSTLYVQSGVGSCATIDSFEITILEPQTTLISETICNDDTLNVNGIAYWFENDFGIQELTTEEGCDSLVEIQLTFFETDTNFINEQICWGGSFTFFGVTLDKDKPSTQVVIPLADKNNCDSVIFVTITFDDPITRNIDQSLCENDSILINGVFYSASNPSGIDTVEVFESCDTILNINVTFDEDIVVLVDDVLCEDESVMIGNEVFDIMNPSGEVTVEGTAGCDSMITVDLTFFEVPMGLLTGEFCSTEIIDTLGEVFSIDNPEMEVVLEGASAQNCDSTVLVSFDFILVDEGMYTEEICEGTSVEVFGVEFDEAYPAGQVTVQSALGCDSLINVLITFSTVSSDFELNPVDCETEIGYFIFQDFSILGTDYFYSLDNGSQESISIGDTIFDINPGEHSIVLSSAEGCSDVVDFSIAVSDNITLNIAEIVVIQEGSYHSVDIQGLGNATITWTPPTNISCTDCPNPTFDPSEDTEYVINVVDDAGCTATDTILIRVEQSFDIYIPNTFTPNEDGINDMFLIFSESDIEYSLTVYDRWGNRVYQGFELVTNDINSGWNGRFSDRAVSQGVYVFVAELMLEDAEMEIRKGTVTLTR